jgi:hypothetical protein|tara:strand:- start:585 stop:923 length:339 start_codon:yes stop_codon:yes gene_type:complete
MNNKQIITDEDVQKSLDFLRDNALIAAQYKAERIYLEEYRKSLKALLMKNHIDLPVSAQEREAYASPVYIQHLESMKIAIQRDEKQRFLRVSAEAKIEAWRTMSSNIRSIKL